MKELVISLVLIMVFIVSLAKWVSSDAINTCAELISSAQTHSDTVIVYSARVSHYAAPCKVYLTRKF